MKWKSAAELKAQKEQAELKRQNRENAKKEASLNEDSNSSVAKNTIAEKDLGTNATKVSTTNIIETKESTANTVKESSDINNVILNETIFEDNDTYECYSVMHPGPDSDSDFKFFEKFVEGKIECRLYQETNQSIGMFIFAETKDREGDSNIEMTTPSIPLESMFANIENTKTLIEIRNILDNELKIRGLNNSKKQNQSLSRE